MEEYKNISHTFEPIYDKNSRILILGSFPSVKSRENNFYYGHPQNRFWKVLSILFQEELPHSVEEKKKFLLRNRIAVWDVIKTCTITGSGDASIRDVLPNDFSELFMNVNFQHIFANGNKAYDLYMKFVYPDWKIAIQKLPSTSPANASYSLEKLLENWKVITS